MRSRYRVAVLDKVTDFLLFLGKLLIVGIVGEFRKPPSQTPFVTHLLLFSLCSRLYGIDPPLGISPDVPECSSASSSGIFAFFFFSGRVKAFEDTAPHLHYYWVPILVRPPLEAGFHPSAPVVHLWFTLFTCGSPVSHLYGHLCLPCTVPVCLPCTVPVCLPCPSVCLHCLSVCLTFLSVYLTCPSLCLTCTVPVCFTCVSHLSFCVSPVPLCVSSVLFLCVSTVLFLCVSPVHVSLCPCRRWWWAPTSSPTGSSASTPCVWTPCSSASVSGSRLCSENRLYRGL